jgi:hypothetical protein
MSFKTSLQRDLDRFYKVLFESDFNIREVTKGALSKPGPSLTPGLLSDSMKLRLNLFTGMQNTMCDMG